MSEALTLDPAEAERRVEALADPEQDVLSIVRTGGTQARAFYAIVRTWDHPEADETLTLCVQNAQLTAEWSDMSDEWLTGSYRQRVPKGDGESARALAQSLAGAAAQIDRGVTGEKAPDYHDATGE